MLQLEPPNSAPKGHCRLGVETTRLSSCGGATMGKGNVAVVSFRGKCDRAPAAEKAKTQSGKAKVDERSIMTTCSQWN